MPLALPHVHRHKSFMANKPDILCIGSVLWDVIGRSDRKMIAGSDVPGRITRIPGGVAMNIAMTLRDFGMTPALLSAVGQDDPGDELIEAAQAMGLITNHIYMSKTLPTDVYMAIEGANGLIAAIADAHSLEAAGHEILRPLQDGRLGTVEAPWSGPIALDGNLTTDLLEHIKTSAFFAQSDLRVAPASPGKADRLLALVGHPTATFYVNLEEANTLCDANFETSTLAANALILKGIYRAAVTNGAQDATIATAKGQVTNTPPTVTARRITGAGDTFMAAHIAAEMQGAPDATALARALQAAAVYVSGEKPA